MSLLYVHSSKVASITLHNQYVTKSQYVEMFQLYLYKRREEMEEYDRDVCNVKYLNFNEKTSDELPEKVKEKLSKIVNKVEKNITNKEFNKQSKKILSTIEKLDLSESDKQIVSNEMKKQLNCKYGSKKENSSIQLFEKQTNNKVYSSNESLFTRQYDTYYICGMVDGFVDKDNNTYIFEMKNRKNRMFSKIPMYEKIQLLCYTKLCNNNNIIFTQCYDKKLKIEEFNEYEDNDLWELVLYRLKSFTDLIYEFRDNENLRHTYLKLSTDDDKYEFLSKYLNWL